MHRRMLNNPMWLSEPFTRAQAWVDMLLIANRNPSYLRIRGNRIDIPVGGIGRSNESLCERWKWSRGKLNRYLKELEKDGQIVQQKSRVLSVITICNYEHYQVGDTTDSTTDGTTDGTTDEHQTVQQTVHEQESKEVKKEKNKRYTPPDWVPLSLWKSYLASRRSKRHPMNPEALDLCVKAIAKVVESGVSVEHVLERMTETGWRSCKPEWFRDQPVTHGLPGETIEQRSQRLQDELNQELRVVG